MHKLSLAIAALAVYVLPSAAQAGWVVEASVGRGMQVEPSVDDDLGPTNLLVAPGYGLGEVLRAEVGFVIDLPEENVGTNLRLRPMLVIDPPILPLYGRLIVGVANLLENERAFEFGGAVGIGGSIGGIGLYAEVGALPQAIAGDFIWIAEGRAGAYLAF